jgi:hypothetical protein
MLFIYAIAAGGARRGGGAGERGLRSVRLAAGAPLFAVVEDVPEAPVPSPDSLRAYDAVVRTLLDRCDALLPASFGSVVADEGELLRRLSARTGDLAAALGLVRGCVQMSVRVFGRALRPVPSPKRVGTAALGAGTRYLLEKADEWRAAESLPEIEPLRLRLAGLVRAERVERHQTPGLVGTAHHLVERDLLSAYRARVRAAAAALRPVRIHVTGPWAAYAFAPRALA